MTHDPADDLIPVSVRLGEVVPPEDPEDWTRPLTWVAAFGMLTGPIVALAWFLVGPPEDAAGALLPTYLVATSLAAGAAATGATQVGPARAFTATLGAGLFAALVVVILGVVMAGERQVGSASPTVVHASVAAAGGLAGAGIDAVIVAIGRGVRARLMRLLPALLVGAIAGIAVVAALMQAPPTPDAPAGRAEQCNTELAGHLVTVTYPSGWWAGNPEGAGDPCIWFSESPIDGIQADAQIVLGDGSGPTPPHPDEVSRQELAIDGRPAVRIIWWYGTEGAEGRTVGYNISVGETLEDGPVIVALTDSAYPGDYEANVLALDRMMETLRIGPGG